MSGEQIPTPPERSEVNETRPQEEQGRVSDHSPASANRVSVDTDVSDDVYSVTIPVEATAYTAFCDTGCIGITATGVDVRNTIYHEGKNVIATDPSVVPLGTTVTLTFADGSTMEAIAADVGGAIKGQRIDILFSNESEAVEFGRQEVQVTIHEQS